MSSVQMPRVRAGTTALQLTLLTILGVHTGGAAITVTPGASVAVNPRLFGLNDVIGPIINLTYHDTALEASTKALRVGALRHPGGTVADYWSLANASYVSSASDCTCSCCKYQSRIDAFPPQTFSPSNFSSGIGSLTAATNVFDINLFTLDPVEAAKQIDLLHSINIPSPQLIEGGNEFYISKNYHRRFPNATAYGTATIPSVQRTRELFPDGQFAVVGAAKLSPTSNWNKELKPFLHLYDAVTVHDYSYPKPVSVASVLKYAASDLQLTAANAREAFPGLDVWGTEYNLGLSGGFSTLPTGAHALYIAGRQLAAVVEPNWKVLQLHAFLSQDGNGWDSKSGIVQVSMESNDMGALRVSAAAQVFAHVAHTALGAAGSSLDGRTMHSVEASGDSDDCLQGAAFQGPSSLSYILLNRCEHAVNVTFASSQSSNYRVGAAFTHITYDANDNGTALWAPLPADPSVFPWAGPLTATKHVSSNTDTAQLPALSMTVSSFV